MKVRSLVRCVLTESGQFAVGSLSEFTGLFGEKSVLPGTLPGS